MSIRILYGKQPENLIGGPYACYCFTDGQVTASVTGCQSLEAAQESASEFNRWYGNMNAEVKEVTFTA